jgi:hypothetical protein
MKTMKKTDEASVSSTINKTAEERDEEEGSSTRRDEIPSFLIAPEQDIKEEELGGMDYDYEQEFDDDDEALFDEETEQVSSLKKTS